MSLFWIIVLVILALIVIGLFAYLVRIVPQAKAYVIERLGAYHTTWNTGVHFLVPFIDRVSNKVTLKEVVKDLRPSLELKISTDEEEAFTDADFIMAQMRVGGLKMRVKDEQISLKHGCIGQETCEPGEWHME